MRTIGYVRVSTEDQAREGVSLDAQRAKIEAYCQVKDLHLVEIIEDAGISAKNLDRPGVQRALELVRNKKVDAVVVLKLDRMFRSTLDTLATIKEFEALGVSYHSIQETIDTKSAMGRFFLKIIAAIAEMERDLTIERVNTTIAHKRANGGCVGGVPYGFSKVGKEKDSVLIENPAEQATIKAAREMYVKVGTIRGVTRCLNQAGVTTRTGREFDPTQVRRMLDG